MGKFIDFFNREINIGDFILTQWGGGADFQVGRVIRFTAEQLVFCNRCISEGDICSCSGNRKYPSQVIVISPDDVKGYNVRKKDWEIY